MKNLFIACLSILFCSSMLIAQENGKTVANKKANFSGVWIPQGEKQNKPDAKRDDCTNVIIEQSKQEIKFTLIYPKDANPPKREFKFFIDERGEINNGMVYFFLSAGQPNSKSTRPDDEIKSKTRWDKDALLITHQLVIHDGAVTLNIEVTMRWEISDDGKTLTRTMNQVIKSATYRQKTAEGEKDLPVAVQADTKESKDYYVLLETKS